MTSDEQLLTHADELNATVSKAQRELFALLREIDRREAWRADGAQSLAQWVSIRYGISAWKAERWVGAAETLESLPLLAQAFTSGLLGIDKVVELARFATPETEQGLIVWAYERASCAIKRRGDLERRRERQETLSAERERSLRWWYSEDGTRFGLEAELPADQGAVVAKALTRLADSTPVMPGDHDHPSPADLRRADALVMLCSGSISSDPDQDRATVVVHTKLETLLGAPGTAVAPSAPGTPNGEVEHGPVITPETVQRLACDARLQVVTEDAAGNPFRLGRITRTPSAAMVRALRYRDRECRFPGCGRRRFTAAHHVKWWSRGGRTDLENLVLLCGFHHRLVHEGGWNLRLDSDTTVTWFRPNGVRYRAGPAP